MLCSLIQQRIMIIYQSLAQERVVAAYADCLITLLLFSLVDESWAKRSPNSRIVGGLTVLVKDQHLLKKPSRCTRAHAIFISGSLKALLKTLLLFQCQLWFIHSSKPPSAVSLLPNSLNSGVSTWERVLAVEADPQTEERSNSKQDDKAGRTSATGSLGRHSHTPQ